VVVRVAEVHEELLKLQRQQEAGTETIRRLDRMVRLTQARERQGRATRVDVLRGEQKLGSARQRQTGIDQQLTSRRADFSELLGFEPGTVFIAEVAPVPKVDVTGVEEALVVALRHRLDYAQLQQDEQDAARGMRIARRNLLPNLDIVTRYEKAGSGADASAAAKLDEDIWLVGLSSSSDLPMRSERLAVERAGLAREAAAIRMEAVRATVDRQVRQAASVYRRSVLDTETTARNYRLAERGAQLAQRMFERGRGDSFTLSNAEDERQSTEDVWLNAQAGEMIAAYHLLRVLGTLIEYPADLMPLMGGQP
jgi:outer membrane protein TolC